MILQYCPSSPAETTTSLAPARPLLFIPADNASLVLEDWGGGGGFGGQDMDDGCKAQ